MNLEEKLSELRNNILRDTSALIAGSSDSLWSDETLLRYIKDAERRFARQSLVIRDANNPQYTRITLKTGIVTYPLDKLVLGVLSARFDTDDFDLQKTGHSILSMTNPPEFLSFDPNTSYNIAPGRPLAVYSDETVMYAGNQRVTLSVYPAPSSAEDGKNINLRVFRLPSGTYSLNKPNECTEIPEDYQLDVLEWAAYRAQRNYDADGASLSTATDHKQRFDDAVKEALKETRRKMFVPMNVRFGENGFSWIR